MSKDKLAGLITVRSKSTRLPGKCFLPFGDETIISHAIKRAILYDIEPIVCTTDTPEDDKIVNIAKEIGVKVFRGSEINKLKRWADCAKFFNIKLFHTIDADDPFFDGDEMKRSLELLDSGGYDVITPTESSSEGGASVGYSLTSDIVCKVCKGIPDKTDTEMMWYFLENVPRIKIKKLPDYSKNNHKMRLTLDYEEDYWLLESVRRILGNFASREEVSNLFSSNPDLYKINYFRNAEWKSAQLSKKI